MRGHKAKAWAVFILILAVTLAAEFLITRQGHFGADQSRFFYAMFGFVSCAGIIFVSKLLGKFLSRRDDYYGKPRD